VRFSLGYPFQILIKTWKTKFPAVLSVNKQTEISGSDMRRPYGTPIENPRLRRANNKPREPTKATHQILKGPAAFFSVLNSK